MSLVHFDDFYEICYCIMRERTIVEEMKQHEENSRTTNHPEWWEKAVEEIKKERELFYV